MTGKDFLDNIKTGNLGDVISYITKASDINDVITDWKNGQKFSALGWAVYYRQPVVVKVLIHHKADVNKSPEENNARTPLRTAVEKKSAEIVRDLVKAGANVNEEEGIFSRTILEVAAQMKNLEILEILADKVADFGEHPKFLRILLDTENKEILWYLRRIGFDINKKYNDMGSPLFYCVGSGKDRMVEWLVENGVKMTITSAFIRAVEVGNVNILNYFKNQGANINFHYKNGISPLLLSLQLNQKDVACYLLDNGADPDFADKDGNRPLILAIQQNHPEIVKKLIEHKVDTDITDKEGNTPLALALQLKQTENTKILMTECTKDSFKEKSLFFLMKFIEQKSIDNVKSLLEEKKINLSGFDDSGWTPLTKSVNLGLVEIAEMLIEKKAQVNQADKNRKTPMMIALTKFNLELIDLLVRSGSDLKECKETMDKLASENDDFAYFLQSIQQ